MIVHKVRSKEDPFYLYRFYILHYVQIKTRLSHLGILCENFLKYNFRRCHHLNPISVLFNLSKAEPFPYKKRNQCQALLQL